MNCPIFETNARENALSNITFTKKSGMGFMMEGTENKNHQVLLGNK